MAGKYLCVPRPLRTVIMAAMIGVVGTMLFMASTPEIAAWQQQSQTPPPTQSPVRTLGSERPPPGVTAAMLQDPQTGQWYTPMQHAEYAFGADLSFSKQLEEGGKVFKDTDGQPKPVLQIFRNHGYKRTSILSKPVSTTLPANTSGPHPDLFPKPPKARPNGLKR